MSVTHDPWNIDTFALESAVDARARARESLTASWVVRVALAILARLRGIV